MRAAPQAVLSRVDKASRIQQARTGIPAHWHKGQHLTTPASLFAGIDFARGRLYRTDDVEEARQLCGRVFTPHDLKVVGRRQHLQASMDHLRLGRISLNRLSWGATVAVDPDRLGDYYLISMPVRGRAQFSLAGCVTEVSTHCAGIVNAAQRFRFEGSEDFEQVVVWLDRRALEAGWQALTGAALKDPIDFDCGVTTGGSAWRALESVMQWVSRRACVANDASVRHEHFDARLEEMLVTTLLLNAPHSHSAQLWPSAVSAAPWHLRRAEEYMRENIETALTLGQVARECGVSARTLQAAFQAGHGQGPMQWLREQRLHAVREALITASGSRPAVGQIALRFGFTHLGEFSQAYRRCFGETARETLLRRS